LNLPFFIARRYLFGKKSHNAINIVSAISMGGVIVGTAAFILLLSVFNGFDQLVRNMYNSFYADVEVTPSIGKVFNLTSDSIIHLQKIEGINKIAFILEDNAMMVNNDKQTVSMVRGVSDLYKDVTSVNDLMWQGDYKLFDQNMPQAIMGRGLAYQLNVNPDLFEHIKIYVPKRLANYSNDPNKTLTSKSINVSGIFASQPDIDAKYTLVPIEFARNLFGYSTEYSSFEIKLNTNSNEKKVISEIRKYLGSDFKVKDRYQQNELLYKTMRTEKWAIFLILALVLVILLFSLVGSITMLIIEKKKDVSILNSMGASRGLIQKIFFREGFLITLAGVLLGSILGSLIALIQEHFKIIKLNGGFVIDAYPVDLQWGDILIVSVTVILIGTFSSWYPIRFLLRKNIIEIG
jgi:lipoprotein-releasing system permease protein